MSLDIDKLAARTSASPGQSDSVDYTLALPDECLAWTFKTLKSGDRKGCSVVCRRWLKIEAQSRRILSLNAKSDLIDALPSLLARFTFITCLILKCDGKSASIGDEALILISLNCKRMRRLKLVSCPNITADGIGEFSKNCKKLKTLCCSSCAFGSRGVNNVLQNCPGLVELCLHRLSGITEPIVPGIGGSSLKFIYLRRISHGRRFGPLIKASKSLRTLSLVNCSGNLDKLFLPISERNNKIKKMMFNSIKISSTVVLKAISRCPNLVTLMLPWTSGVNGVFTDADIAIIAKSCTSLKILFMGQIGVSIGEQGLIAVAENCSKLQGLVIFCAELTLLSLETLGAKCLKLEYMLVGFSESLGDPELLCIATNCNALKDLCIVDCPISDDGIKALASGCPNLDSVQVCDCSKVTLEGVNSLRAIRPSLDVSFKTDDEPNGTTLQDSLSKICCSKLLFYVLGTVVINFI